MFNKKGLTSIKEPDLLFSYKLPSVLLLLLFNSFCSVVFVQRRRIIMLLLVSM